MSDKVTRNDINMIDYYLINKGDIRLWPEWYEREYIISKQFPELLKAINNFNASSTVLNKFPELDSAKNDFDISKKIMLHVAETVVRKGYKEIKE